MSHVCVNLEDLEKQIKTIVIKTIVIGTYGQLSLLYIYI